MRTDPSGTTRRTVLKSFALGAAICMAGDMGTAASAPASRAPRNRSLPRCTPEELGVDPAGILAFVDACEQKVGGLHSFILVRHGHVAAEGWWAPYAPGVPHMLFSLSKSFTSTAVGLAVADGRLTVDAPVLSFFPKEKPAKVSDNLAAMQVRHLLSMSTGHDQDATGPAVSDPDGNWAKGFLSVPVDHEPGTHFVYNSAATYMCSAIVQQLTGKTVLDYLKPRIMGPLGIIGATWETCPRGIDAGGWGLSVKTEDIARFGKLYLQKGQWEGRQLLPSAWVAEATSKHISNGTDPNSDWAQGYGYQFWRCRHSAYRGDGAFGQYCVVLPEQDAVLAITSGVQDMQAVLNIVWEELLPAMRPDPLPLAVPDEMRRRLARLSVAAPDGKAGSPMARQVSGRIYRFDANDQKVDSVSLAFERSRCTIALRDDKGEHSIVCGSAGWAKGVARLGDNPEAKVAARGAWTADDTYTAKLCFYETPFVHTWILKFAGDELTASLKANVGFGPTEARPLVGRRA